MVQIIAEAGVNHNGDINLAREMVEVAADLVLTGLNSRHFLQIIY